MTIMIIDDDEDDSLIFREALQEIDPGIICLVAHTCDAATEMIQENQEPPAIIFLDAYMYPMGGKECLLTLNAIEKLIDTRIIIHSGALSPAQIDEFTFLGADKVISKTNSHQALTRVLQDILAA